jgi:hypothetical protein
LQRPRLLVLRAGRIIAETEPAQSTVVWNGVPEDVDFTR